MKFTRCNCAVCGKEFYAKRSDAKFCTAACKQRDQRIKNKLKFEPSPEDRDYLMWVYNNRYDVYSKFWTLLERFGVVVFVAAAKCAIGQDHDERMLRLEKALTIEV